MKTLELDKPEILSHLEKMTEEAFVEWYDEDEKAEFIDGEVIVHSPVSIDHVSTGTFLMTLLNLLIHENDLGKFFGSSRKY